MTLVADTITSHEKGTTLELSTTTTYLNATTKLSLDQGLIKGYCTEYDQSDDSVERTFNLSSLNDQRTGVVDYYHTNNYLAKRGYWVRANDARYGVIGVESQDILPSECHSNEWNGGDSTWNLADGNHQCTFGGELA